MIFCGYVFTVLNYICYWLSCFMKNKAAIVALDLTAKVLMAFGLYCFHSLSGAYLFILMFIMLIASNIKERLHKKWVWGYVLFQCAYILAWYYTHVGFSSILVFLTASTHLVIVWLLPPQQMRLVGSFNCLIFFAYLVSIKNWAVGLEVFSFLSNVLAYLTYRKKAIAQK